MKKLLFASVTTIVLTAGSVQATTLFDSLGFESPTYNLGALSGQNGWTTDGSGLSTVENTVVQSGGQAVRLSGTSSDWHYPDLSYTPSAGEIVRVTAGIERAAPVSGGATNFGFFLDAYNSSVARIARVGLGASGGSPAIFATYLGGSGAGTYVLATGLSWNTWYDFQFDLNFTTQSFDLYVNNNLIASNLAFLTAATDVADVDLMMSYTTGATDAGYFDNYRVVTVAPVPEPGLLSLAGLGGAALIAARRRAAARK